MSFALPDALFFTGIDWAAETHAVCVTDAEARSRPSSPLSTPRTGSRLLVRRLARYGMPGDMPVAIERPNGRLALLLEAGHPVPVKPNAIKAWRDGEVLSGAKSDAGDAAVIAEYLRLRLHKLKVAAPDSDETNALRTVVRARDDLVEMRVAATNQLAALVDAHWPGAKAIFADVESPISLEFLTRYPTPASAAPPMRQAHSRILRQARLLRPPQRRRPARAPAPCPARRRLRGAHRGAARRRARRRRRAQALNAAIKSLDRSIAADLGEHPDGAIFTSLPRPGHADWVLAEWGDCRQAYEHPELRRRPRQRPPVTKESGKHRAVHFP